MDPPTSRLVTLLLSSLCLCVLTASTALFVVERLMGASSPPPVPPLRWAFSTVAPALIALRGYRKGSLSASGAALAVLVGVALTAANVAFFAALLVFFLTSSRATRSV